MKIRLSEETARFGGCMTHWFTIGRIYEAVEGTTDAGWAGYTLETDQGYPDTFTATYFEVVQELPTADGIASRFAAETNRRVDGE